MSYTKKVPRITIYFDFILKPKVAKNENEQKFLDGYYQNKFYNYEKFGGYKYNLLNPDEKEVYIRTHSSILSQIIGICGTIETETQSVDFKLIDQDDEKSVVKEFIEKVINDHSVFEILWVHYGGLSFECPMVLRKAASYGLSVGSSNFTNLAKFRINPHYDMAALLGNWGTEAVDFETACQELGIDYKEFTGSTSNLTDKEVTDIAFNKINAYKEMYKILKKIFH